MGNCVNGVNVTIGEEIFSLKPETTQNFFETQVLKRI